MTNADEFAALEHKLEHAAAIALVSIGQPDRAENVAYRERVRAELKRAKGRPPV